MKYFFIYPAGEIAEELLHSIGTGLTEIYGYPYQICQPVTLSGSSFNANRQQYNAEILIAEVAEKLLSSGKKLLVVDVDLFVPGKNFILGMAYGNIAVESLVRLRPEYYGDNNNEMLSGERALKEAIHELGHTFGLHHCPEKSCIMHFSNSTEEIDIKGFAFCRCCSIMLKRKSIHFI